MGNLFFWPFF